MVCNEYGIGLLVEISEFVKVFELFFLFGRVIFVDVISNIVIIKWEKLESDGGSKIIGYVVEM